MRTAQEYFNLTTEELDAIIAQRLEEGWKFGTKVEGYPCFFLPPDDRINWCAEWIPYKDAVLPHWMNRER